MVNKVKNKKAFTLIELLISIGVLGIALTVTAGVLLSVIKSSQKQKIIAEVERNGEFVMSYIQKMGAKALLVECKSLSGTIGSCNGVSASELSIGQGSAGFLYVGLKQGPSISCNGVTKTNNFVYATNNDSGITANSDSIKLSNDSINGVNISNLSFNVTSGNPAYITVTMTVQGSNCGSWNVSKQFQSFITVRGTY